MYGEAEYLRRDAGLTHVAYGLSISLHRQRCRWKSLSKFRRNRLEERFSVIRMFAPMIKQATVPVSLIYSWYARRDRRRESVSLADPRPVASKALSYTASRRSVKHILDLARPFTSKTDLDLGRRFPRRATSSCGSPFRNSAKSPYPRAREHTLLILANASVKDRLI